MVCAYILFPFIFQHSNKLKTHNFYRYCLNLHSLITSELVMIEIFPVTQITHPRNSFSLITIKNRISKIQQLCLCLKRRRCIVPVGLHDQFFSQEPRNINTKPDSHNIQDAYKHYSMELKTQ